ncbi:calpain-9-like [Babylonia areolata]|uniref:calpain-9-like n=1 Tax=Babylonia areolata TaxID=304850 RepID=UPI003FD14068
MAFSSSPRKQFQEYDGRGPLFEKGGGLGSQDAYYVRDPNLHDYTNIATASRNHEKFKDKTIPFASPNGKEASSVPQYRSIRNDEGPASPPPRVDASTVQFQARERREDVVERRNPSAVSFEQLREELLQQGHLFEDEEFKPVIASIYYSRRPSHPIQWMRPRAICGRERPVFARGGFSRFDVKQGDLGDCWFVAAMACICGPDHHQLLERVVPDKLEQSFQDGEYAGMFRFRFWHFGEWKEVVIDDLLPTVRGALTFIHSPHRAEFWSALMEKAYAKVYGSYEALKSGVMADSLTDLTGGVAETYKLSGEEANYPRNIISVLFKAIDRGALIGCSIMNTTRDGSEGYLANGLVTGHAYSVTGLRQVPLQGREVILIRIRNPHGSKNEWRGPWGDSSPEWQQVSPRMREQLGLVRRSDGEFWMDFEDFMDNFDGLVICSLTPDAPVAAARKWYTAEHHGRWVKNFNAGGRPTYRESHWANPQYVLKLRDTDEDDDNSCSVIVQLMQKDRRKLKQKGEENRFIGFIIYKVPPNYALPLTRDFFNQHRAYEGCDTFINTRQIVKRFTLPPGVYVVVPCTYDKDKEADFFIRFFFEKGNVSEYADEPPERVPVPPATPSPKYKEQQDEFQKFFYEMSGEDMEINCFELHKAVNEGLRKEPLHREIGLDACRSFVSLMDVDNSGRLGFTEFLYLWNMLRTWKKTFLEHDADNSGKMDSRELRSALASNGYKVSNQMMAAAVFRYADPKGSISLDDFLILMARLTKIFNVYQKHLKKDAAVFTLQQWVEESLTL